MPLYVKDEIFFISIVTRCDTVSNTPYYLLHLLAIRITVPKNAQKTIQIVRPKHRKNDRDSLRFIAAIEILLPYKKKKRKGQAKERIARKQK